MARSFTHIRISIVFLLIVFARGAAQMPAERSGEIRTVVTITPGVQGSDGFSTLGTLHRFHVASGDYLPYTFLIKIKGYHEIAGTGADAFPREIRDLLRPYAILSVRMPFPWFASSSLASADRYGLGRLYEVTFSADADMLDLCARLNSHGDVEYAEPVYIRRTAAVPNDPRFAEQYALAKAEASGAWDITQGDTSVTIAIVDAGVDWDHQDLAANIWTNPREIPGNNIDDDGNGKIDDLRGWDLVGNVTPQQAIFNSFQQDNDPGITDTLNPNDGRYHGTHCAGVAGAVTNNSIGIAGMGYRSRLIPVKVGSDQIPGSIYRGYEGIMYAATVGADIISCSWGGGTFSQAEQDVIDQATAMGSLVVAASGNNGLNNDNFKHYPSCYRNVLSVGASTDTDAPALFSNYGITTTLFASGVNILSTVGGDRYDDGWSGTSMATPLVSGLAALIRSLHPDWTPLQITHQIRGTVDNVVAVDSTDRPRYFGRVNGRRGLAANRDGVDTNVVPGIGIVSATVNASGGIITDTMSKDLRLMLRNYLGPATDLRITIVSNDNDVMVTNGSVIVDSIGMMDSVSLQFSIRVISNSAWYQGTADLLVRYQSEGYDDYELVQIPYSFPSANTYTLLVAGLPGNTIARAGHSPAPNVLWGVGEVPGLGGGYARYSGGGFTYNFISPTALTSVFSFDANRAVAVSGSTIYRTTNGGTQWTNTSVSAITSSIQSVNFLSIGSGVIIGNPAGGVWGIATTSDSGRSWSPLASTPGALDGETVDVNGICWRGTNGWFGTSKGRVFRTTDGGLNWTASVLSNGASISFLAFASSGQGVAIYRAGSDASLPYLIAATTDSGATWETEVARIGDLGVVPVHLASPGRTDAYVIMGNDGRVLLSSDNGRSWSDEPSMKTNGVITAGTTSSDNAKIRVWSLGTSIGYLDIPYSSSSAPMMPEIPTSPAHIASIHPNPATGRMTLHLALYQGGAVVIDLANEAGERVYHRNFGTIESGMQSLVVDVEDLPSGTYLCRASIDGVTESRVVIVRR